MLNELLRKNRSYRSFCPDIKIDRNLLLEFIENTRAASATMNVQPLKYKIVTDESDIQKILPLLRWATALKDIKLPPKGHEPTAFIIICHDESVIPFSPMFLKDVGICAEIIMLSAAEAGYGGCMIGSGNPQDIAEALMLPKNLFPQLVLALGKPDESVVTEDAADGNTAYYRDENGVHHAPKRLLGDIIID